MLRDKMVFGEVRSSKTVKLTKIMVFHVIEVLEKRRNRDFITSHSLSYPRNPLKIIKSRDIHVLWYKKTPIFYYIFKKQKMQTWKNHDNWVYPHSVGNPRSHNRPILSFYLRSWQKEKRYRKLNNMENDVSKKIEK